MLHGVRFLQSQLHARVAEFSLKDWLATFKEHELSEANVASHARKAHRDAKVHCFLSGLAVAVEGELPARGVVLVAADKVDFALRVISSLTPAWYPSAQHLSVHDASVGSTEPSAGPRQLQTAATALSEGVLVVWPIRTVARAHTEELMHLAAKLTLPIVGAMVEESSRTPKADALDVLLARRDVLVTIGTPLTTNEAQAIVSAECTRLTNDARTRINGRSREWKPADAALS